MSAPWRDGRERSFDVAVLGAGIAGMCAAARASQAGARVIVLDPAPSIGGSAALSHGNVWTVADTSLLASEDPGSYCRHASMVVDEFAAVTTWLAGFGGVTRERTSSRFRQVQQIDVSLTLLRMAQTVFARGGVVELESRVADLERTPPGLRLALTTPAGASAVHVDAVVVATGGRQADPQVRSALNSGAPALLRGNRHSDGSGIALAQSLGASVNFANRGFYGHLMPVGVAPLSGLDYLALTLYHSAHGVLLDRTGKRFTHERNGDARNAMALADRGGIGLLLWSEKVQRAAALDPAPVELALDRWRYAADRGAHVSRAATAAEALLTARAWGFDGLSEHGEEDLRGLGTGPTYIAHVVPGITFTYGGLRADDGGRVLDAENRSIAGLFTAGADLSDIYHRGYCGGLSAAAVTGRRAGAGAAAHAHSLKGKPSCP